VAIQAAKAKIYSTTFQGVLRFGSGRHHL